MATVEVFDPAMCCSTGVCGTSVDPTLARFAADLDWLSTQGVAVERATVSQEPAKFVATVPVRDALTAQGEEALPAVMVDGRLRSTGRYPTRGELADWVGVAADQAAAPVLAPAGATLLPQTGGCCGGGVC